MKNVFKRSELIIARASVHQDALQHCRRTGISEWTQPDLPATRRIETAGAVPLTLTGDPHA